MATPSQTQSSVPPAQQNPAVPPSPPSTSPPVSQFPKPRLPLYLAGGLTLLIIITVVSFRVASRFFQSNPNPKPTPQLSSQQTIDELKDIPIYPRSNFVSANDLPDCNSAILEAMNKGYDAEAAKILVGEWCDGSEYLFSVSAPFKEVVSWYENDISKSSFKLMGGAGAEGINRYGRLTNGKQTYLMSIRVNEYSIMKPKASTQINLTDEELIKFIKTKFNITSESLISIKKIEGNYAWGTASTVTDGAGFYWAAAKTNGEWSYAFAGNGIPNCGEVEIFPPTVFDGKFNICYDESRKETIYRSTGEKL